MSYLTINEEASAEFEEKKSTFIGNVKRIYSEEDAKAFINKIKSQNKEARHNVYAYIIGENMGVQRYSDDGEPQGTGGVPVLDVIKKSGITDVVVVVTRYFGGILLGTGGLVRAYSKGASLAIKAGGIVEKVKACSVDIVISYDLVGKLQYLLAQKIINIEASEYTDNVKITIFYESAALEDLKNEIVQVTSGKCNFNIGDEQYYFKQENRLFME